MAWRLFCILVPWHLRPSWWCRSFDVPLGSPSLIETYFLTHECPVLYVSLKDAYNKHVAQGATNINPLHMYDVQATGNWAKINKSLETYNIQRHDPNCSQFLERPCVIHLPRWLMKYNFETLLSGVRDSAPHDRATPLDIYKPCMYKPCMYKLCVSM